MLRLALLYLESSLQIPLAIPINHLGSSRNFDAGATSQGVSAAIEH